ncbi:MAG: hypothetical protein GY913_15485 [Proteobacteria bacterium]|nr:hypothetical protein [Pseudomonadota bacterium]MCP4918311.1 hypothetical protein [Pseudomonadota bacterium]
MKPHRRVFVVGGGHTTFQGKGRPEFVHRRHPEHGKRKNPDLEAHLGGAVREALAVTGVDPALIDRAVVSNFLGEAFCSQGHMGSLLARVVPELETKPILRVEAACASGSAAITTLMDGMQAGADVCLAAGVEIETNVPGHSGVEYMSYAAHFRTERAREFALFPWMFARRAKAYKEAYGCTHEDLARVAVKAYANASRNPNALKQHADLDLAFASVESGRNPTFLEDEELRPHIHLSDCTALTDGGSAVLLATEDGLRKLGIPMDACTEILAYGHAVRGLGNTTNPRQMENMADAAAVAYRDASVRPDQIELAEVHDCFVTAELQGMEALGLAAEGTAWKRLKDGDTQLDGVLPVNTGGGLIGFGHPIGATGIKQVVEVWKQMTGRADDYQIAGTVRHSVTSNLGGDDRTGIVMVHRAC